MKLVPYASVVFLALLLSVTMVVDATDAEGTQNIDISYSDGELTFFGQGLSGYENQNVTFIIQNSDGEIITNGYTRIDSNGHLVCRIYAGVLKDGQYSVKCQYNKAGIEQKEIGQVFEIHSGIQVSVKQSSELKITGTIPTSLNGSNLTVFFLDSGMKKIGNVYQPSISTIDLSVDVSGADDIESVALIFTKSGHYPTSVICNVEKDANESLNIRGYELTFGTSFLKGKEWKVPCTAKRGDEVYSYNIILKADMEKMTATMTGIESETSIKVIVPNNINIQEKQFTIDGLDCNGSTLKGAANISALILSEKTDVSKIGKNAFKGLTSLSEVLLGEGVKEIGGYAFYSNKFKTIELPSSITTIGQSAFSSNDVLEAVGVVDGAEHYSLKSVKSMAFYNCTSLKTVALPFGEINTLGMWSFGGCKSLETISSVGSGNNYVVGSQENGLISGSLFKTISTTSEGVEIVSYEVVLVPSTCSGVLDLSENTKITSVGPQSFTLTSIEEIILPNSVKEIGDSAFAGLESLNKVTFGNGLTKIGTEAFNKCQLSSIELPDTINTIVTKAFSNNPSLTYVEIKGGSFILPGGTFTGSPVKNITVSDTNSKVILDAKVFGVTSVEEITLDGLYGLKEGCLGSIESLKKVIFKGTNLTDVDPKAAINSNNIESFEYQGEISSKICSDQGCLLLSGVVKLVPIKKTIIEFDVDVKGIDPNAFRSHDKLIEVTFDKNSTLTSIPDSAFAGCSSLTSISIPDSVEGIGNRAFVEVSQSYNVTEYKGCSYLSEIDFGSGSKLKSIGAEAFYGAAITTLNLPASLISIGNDCFAGCNNLTEVVAIGNSLKSIGDGAFKNTPLRSIIIPGSMDSLGKNVFAGCRNLSAISFGQSSKYSFDGNAIYEKIDSNESKLIFLCSGVRSLEVPSFVSEIDLVAFEYASDLSEIIVADSSHYSSENGLLLNKDGNKILYIPMAIKILEIPSGVHELKNIEGRSLFSNRSIETLIWESSSITIKSTSIKGINSAILKSSGNLEISGTAIYGAFSGLQSLVLEAKHMKLGEYITLQSSPSVMISCETLEVVKNTGIIFANGNKINMCVLTSNEKIVKDISTELGKEISKLYVSGLEDATSYDRYSGSFIYNENDNSFEIPCAYIEGASIFFTSSVEQIDIQDVVVSDGKIEFKVMDESNLNGDILVLVNNAEVSLKNGIYSCEIGDATTIKIRVMPYVSDNIIKIHFDTDGGTAIGDVTVYEGSIISTQLPNAPRKSGYRFDGWYIDEERTKKLDSAHRANDGATLYAKWVYNGGKYLVDVINEHSDVILTNNGAIITSGQLLDKGTKIDVKFINTMNWECIGWTVNDEKIDNLTITLEMDRDYYVCPILGYTSPSNVVTSIIDLPTPTYGQDVSLQWSKRFKVDATMSVWSGFPSTPAVIDGYIYVRAGDILYKFDADTGEEIKSVPSRTIVAYYLYLGTGGGTVFDYATGKVYDTNLNLLYESEKKFTAAFYDSGYYYGLITERTGASPITKLYKMEAITGNLVDVGSWKNGVEVNWFGIYGTTSAPVFNDGFIYFIEARTDSDLRCVSAINLSDASKTTVQLTTQSGRLLDDGWLTCTNYGGRTILFLTTYSKGLFDYDGEFKTGSITGILVNKDGTLGDSTRIIDVYTQEGSLSAFIVFNGRGYLAGSHMNVVDADKLCKTIIGSDSNRIIGSEDYMKNYVIYREKAIFTHGSIVVSKAYYEASGKVYIYLLPYMASDQAIYIFEDYEGKTEAGEYYKTMRTGEQYCSQAVRATLKGNLVWYSDSGAVYCYGTPESNPYSFIIIDGDDQKEINGHGFSALGALKDALKSSRIPYEMTASGHLVSINGVDGNWNLESYYNKQWHPVIALSNSINDVNHKYRITLDSGSADVVTVDLKLRPTTINLDIGSDSNTYILSLNGDIPDGMAIVWNADDKGDVVSISVSADKRSATITGLNVGSTNINVFLYGKGYYGEGNCKVNVIRTQASGDSTNTYYFTLVAEGDFAKNANFGSSGYTRADLEEGIFLEGKGENAGAALESALRENGILCSFYSGGDILYWINHIFGLEQYHYPNGNWRYWIQYHNGSYNDWTLGHYMDGGSFELIYGITDESGQVIKPPGYEDNPDNPPSPKPDDPVNPPGPEPIEPDVPDIPNDHLDPTDPTVTVEKDSIQNADGTTTNVQTLTKTEEDGKTTTTVITTTPQNNGTVEEIKSTSNSQTNEGGIKTESSLETVTIKDPNGGVKSETHIEVSVIDTTGSSGTGTKGVTITANDKGGNATVKAVYQEGSQSASVVTEVKTSEENGQVVISHESLDVALKMQEMYSKKIVNENESVKDATKVIQVGSGSSDVNVKLSSDVVKKIADADSAILVSGTAGSMEVSKTVMSNISEYDDIAISVAKAIEDVLTDEQRIAINSDATVVKVKVMSGDKSIGDKLNGEITISIKHVTAPGMVPVAYYVHDDGTMEKVDGKYNMKNNEMVVKTTHCSIYAVIDEAPESSDGNILLYTGIAIAAVIIIAAIATFMLRRR